MRLHYVDRGTGEALVLLHGNGSMIQDFDSSGLIDLAAKNYRVIVFDRPGFGHSDRPHNVTWTPAAQAELVSKALHRLGISRAVVLGHSWGASVAVALALKYPDLVSGLVLASGYYYPTARADVLALSVPALPWAGDVIRHTVSPIASRIIWPVLMSKIFGPPTMPKKFGAFPKEMAVRPSQIRCIGCGIRADGSECLRVQGPICRTKDARQHHRGRERPIDRHRRTVESISCGSGPKQVSLRPGARPHGASNGDRLGHVSHRRNFPRMCRRS